VTVTARLADKPGVAVQRTISILPLPPVQAQVTLGFTSSHGGSRFPRPQAVLIGRKLIMTMVPPLAGRVRLSAYLGRQMLGSCATVTPAGRRFTCRLTLASKISTHARIGVRASLRFGKQILNSYRPPSPIPPVRVHITGPGAFAAGSASRWQFLCGPLSE
jgi:hypothetical protein